MSGKAPNCSATGSQTLVGDEVEAELAHGEPGADPELAAPGSRAAPGCAAAPRVSRQLEDPVAVAAPLERRRTRRRSVGGVGAMVSVVMAGFYPNRPGGRSRLCNGLVTASEAAAVMARLPLAELDRPVDDCRERRVVESAAIAGPRAAASMRGSRCRSSRLRRRRVLRVDEQPGEGRDRVGVARRARW